MPSDDIQKNLDDVGSTQKGQGSVYSNSKEDPNYNKNLDNHQKIQYKETLTADAAW